VLTKVVLSQHAPHKAARCLPCMIPRCVLTEGHLSERFRLTKSILTSADSLASNRFCAVSTAYDDDLDDLLARSQRRRTVCVRTRVLSVLPNRHDETFQSKESLLPVPETEPSVEPTVISGTTEHGLLYGVGEPCDGRLSCTVRGRTGAECCGGYKSLRTHCSLYSCT